MRNHFPSKQNKIDAEKRALERDLSGGRTFEASLPASDLKTKELHMKIAVSVIPSNGNPSKDMSTAGRPIDIQSMESNRDIILSANWYFLTPLIEYPISFKVM